MEAMRHHVFATRLKFALVFYAIAASIAVVSPAPGQALPKRTLVGEVHSSSPAEAGRAWVARKRSRRNHETLRTLQQIRE